MNLSELLRIVSIIQDFIPELLAGQVEYTVPHHVVTVIIPIRPADPVHFPSENILRQKCRDGALPQCLVLPAPLISHPRCTGLGTPYFGKRIIQIPRCVDSSVNIPRNGNKRLFPSVKTIFLFHFYFLPFLTKASVICTEKP